MEPSRVSAEVHSVAERLISLDPVQYDSVINEYFENEVAYNSKGVILHGASQLKKYLNLGSLLAFDSHLIGQTHYNSHDQTAHFAFQRTFYLPTLPASVPFSERANKWLNKQHFRAIFDSELHLNTDQGEGQEPRLFVTKVGPTSRRAAYKLEKLIPYFLIQPVLTFVVLLLASVLGFFNRHSLKQENPVKFALAGVAESYAWLKDAPVDRENYPEPIKQAQDLSDKVGKVVTNAIDTAQQTAHNVTEKAKEMGLPVEQSQHLIEIGLHLPGNALHTTTHVASATIHTIGAIEHTAVQTTSNLVHGTYNLATGTAYNLATGTVNQVERRAKDIGIPIDQYKDLAVKNVRGVGEWFGILKAKAQETTQAAASAAAQAIDDSTRRRGSRTGPAPATITGTAGSAETGQPPIEVIVVNMPTSSQDEPQVVHEVEDNPRLSTGGHDPTALGAPSYAEAAH
ncbi:hypothetical protein I317_07605 [Kwoniella heveanensis CBS 569]|nr:hypothetical protein I317_07605 [Kwoniella heveanensis CBS 569]